MAAWLVVSGTAAGVGFPKSLDVAVKTGTAQTGNGASNTNDWMIGFAPANDPKVAVAVEVPLQATSTSGAEIAGPAYADMHRVGRMRPQDHTPAGLADGMRNNRRFPEHVVADMRLGQAAHHGRARLGVVLDDQDAHRPLGGPIPRA